MRDTVMGDLVWSAEVDRPLNFLAHPGDRVLVGQPREEHEIEAVGQHGSIVVFEAMSGEEVADVPTSSALLYAGP